MSQSDNSKNWRSGLSLAECHRYMLTHKIHCDVTFRVGKEGKLVRAHKYVLACRSPVFDAMLYGDLAESDDIKVPDIEPSTFDALLRFLYCDDVNLTPDTVIAVLYAADKYGVEDLVTKIKSYLDENLTHETVVTTLESAQFFNLGDLVKKCKDFIESNPDPLLQSSNALEISKETLAFIISLNSLIKDELKIYQFLIQWAESQCDRVGMEKTDQNIRTMIGEMIYLIRFHVIDLNSFVKDVCNREILDAQEKLSLQQVIVGNMDKRNTKFKFEERKCKTFQILRGKCVGLANWTYARGFKDFIEFEVNKNVRIHGFIMWGAQSVPYTYKIEGELYENSKQISVVPLQTIESKRSPDETFTIFLPEPMLLSPGMRYRACVRLEGPNSWRGGNYQSSVTEHDVRFKFYAYIGDSNGTSDTDGQFPGFVCSL